MKKVYAAFALLLLSVLFAVGCSTTGTGSHTGSLPEEAGPDGLDQPAESRQTASFFYLKFRRLQAEGDLDQAESSLKAAIEKDGSSSFLNRN